MNDKQVKEKMEGLDALSGGVVFGKEEAWEKLQARMDAKPKRRIVLWYRLAAAAVLLLCISIAALYYMTPEKQIAAHQPSTPVNQNNIPEPEQTPAETTVMAEPEKTIIRTQNNLEKLHPVRLVAQQQQTILPTQPVDTAPTQQIVTAFTQPTVARPLVKKMRVVHINELGNLQEEEPAYANEYKGPSLDISKMKVVSIYDLQNEDRMYRQEQDMTTIAHTSLTNSNPLSFPNTLNRNNPYYHSYAQRPLTIRLNRNN